jgi:hypothetical protein
VNYWKFWEGKQYVFLNIIRIRLLALFIFQHHQRLCFATEAGAQSISGESSVTAAQAEMP